MNYRQNVLETVGRTPLIRLNSVTAGLKATILAKVEYFNPGGSVKDRIGLAMVEQAEQEGLLKPGGTIIEATAGNTGVGLALVAAVKGYRCIFVLPDKMSRDKVNLLKAYGAEVIITPTSVPPDSPESYNGVADRLAREIPGAFRPNQFSNLANPEAHYRTTGPEIWEDTGGAVDVFVAGMGTCGTISGAGRFLKEKKPSIRVVGADPAGSILSGDAPCSYKVEGIGEDFVPYTYDRRVVDEVIRITDRESFEMARRLAREEGLLVGGSAGTAVAAAVKYAMRLDPGKLVVVLLPDTGRNYLTKLHDDDWMRANGFAVEAPKAPLETLAAVAVRPLRSLSPETSLDVALDELGRDGLEELPVTAGDKVVGRLAAAAVLRALREGRDPASTTVGDLMGLPWPVLDRESPVEEAYRILLAHPAGLVVEEEEKPAGLLRQEDLIRHWAARRGVHAEGAR
ncbi:MAG: cystathionine beta-synthase [Firmicutes bacterium]|nr:cystathionine beta-synthase [Bacillota bacterium]